MSKNKIIFHIDINAFFASVEQANNPSLKNKPIVVAGKTKRSVVSCPNYVARKFGIKAAMPIFQAKSLCKNLIIVSHKFHLYEEYSEKFINLLSEKVSNRIEYISLDECYMDVTNLVTEKRTPLVIAQKIQNLVKKELGLGTSIGISYNKFLSKMGSDYKKPMGITQIFSQEDIKKIIWPQPIGNMYFVGKSSEKKLIQNGITTIRDLAKCKDLSLLSSIFGSNKDYFINNANGIGDDELVYSYGEPKSISKSRTLLNDTNDFNEIKIYIKKFAQEICDELNYYDLEGKTLSVFIKSPKFILTSKNKTLPKHINDQEMMYVYFLNMYTEFFSNRKIRLIGVGISNLKKIYERENNLFDQSPKLKTKVNSIKKIIDDVNNKFSMNILKTADKLKS